jgi:predicted transcriptional regulator
MPFDCQQIKAFRRRLGFTQTQLAEKLEVPQCTIARWESGKVAPNAWHIGEMCDFGRVADIDPGFFFPSYSRCTPGKPAA